LKKSSKIFFNRKSQKFQTKIDTLGVYSIEFERLPINCCCDGCSAGFWRRMGEIESLVGRGLSTRCSSIGRGGISHWREIV
jgi:hypothetical protein